jgi:hypothetical protein
MSAEEIHSSVLIVRECLSMTIECQVYMLNEDREKVPMTVLLMCQSILSRNVSIDEFSSAFVDVIHSVERSMVTMDFAEKHNCIDLHSTMEHENA